MAVSLIGEEKVAERDILVVGTREKEVERDLAAGRAEEKRDGRTTGAEKEKGKKRGVQEYTACTAQAGPAGGMTREMLGMHSASTLTDQHSRNNNTTIGGVL